MSAPLSTVYFLVFILYLALDYYIYVFFIYCLGFGAGFAKRKFVSWRWGSIPPICAPTRGLPWCLVGGRSM